MCFTGTKLQILTQLEEQRGGEHGGGREDVWGAGGGGGRGERGGRVRGGGSWTRAAYNTADEAAEIDERMVLHLIQSRDEVGCCPFTSVSCICP